MSQNICKYCDKTFSSIQSKCNHVNKFHQKEYNKDKDESHKLVCRKCNKIFSSRSSLNRHKRTICLNKENIINENTELNKNNVIKIETNNNQNKELLNHSIIKVLLENNNKIKELETQLSNNKNEKKR
jgi:uncharacterized C2H2 Zn-finger protein